MTILSSANITLDLNLLPKFRNSWPELSITVNNNILWKDYVKTPSRVTVALCGAVIDYKWPLTNCLQSINE